jgi:hypothetical protein
MGTVLSWLSANWFSLLQTIGIVGGLLFTAYSFNLNSRLRKFDTLITITDQHRELWLKLFESPELKRLVDPNADLAKRPITETEIMFVNLLILHLTTSLAAVRQGIFPKPAGTDEDIADFLSLPIPRAAWNKTKRFRDPETIRYVEGLLEENV